MIDTQPEVKTKSIFDKMNDMQHEQVVFCQDQHTGLKAIIAIHNTVLAHPWVEPECGITPQMKRL